MKGIIDRNRCPTLQRFGIFRCWTRINEEKEKVFRGFFFTLGRFRISFHQRVKW